MKKLALFAIIEALCCFTKVTIRVAGIGHISGESPPVLARRSPPVCLALKCWRAGTQMNFMLSADAIKYFTILIRNIFVAGIVVASHKNLNNGASFTPKNRFYDSTVRFHANSRWFSMTFFVHFGLISSVSG